MRKESAMKKATFLIGGVENLADAHLEKISKELQEIEQKLVERLDGLRDKLDNTSQKANAAREQISNVMTNESTRYDGAVAKLISRRKYWDENPKYSFQFEKVQFKQPVKKSKIETIKNWWVKKITSSLGVISWLNP